MPYSVKCLLEVNQDMIEIFLVFSQRILKLKFCSVLLCPARKPACSSAMMFSACGLSLFRMTFSMTAWVVDDADCPVVLTQL